MSKKKDMAMARKRAEIILKVRNGQLTATEAARELGVSRKTYYKWENRALEAMVNALEDRNGGRPIQEKDPEKEHLQKELVILEREKAKLEERLLFQYDNQLLDLESLNVTANPAAKKK